MICPSMTGVWMLPASFGASTSRKNWHEGLEEFPDLGSDQILQISSFLIHSQFYLENWPRCMLPESFKNNVNDE